MKLGRLIEKILSRVLRASFPRRASDGWWSGEGGGEEVIYASRKAFASSEAKALRVAAGRRGGGGWRLYLHRPKMKLGQLNAK